MHRLFLVALTAALVAGPARALDLNKIKDTGKAVTGTDVGQAANDAAMAKLTKKLKSVQNEKGPIRFKTGKAEVDPKCDKTMQAIADILAEFPGFHVQIDGHTDNVGDPKKNLDLSQARSQAVADYLVTKKQADAKRLSGKGWGDTQPIADNKTAAGRAKNRRVDFTVTKM